MRLIVFVKAPELIEPIPLDIIDDRPSKDVLSDILVIAKLSTKTSLATNYTLARDGTRLNPSLSLSQNGIKNGELLDLIKTNNENLPVTNSLVVGLDSIDKPAEVYEEVKSIKSPEKKSDRTNIPGKKIDFD